MACSWNYPYDSFSYMPCNFGYMSINELEHPFPGVGKSLSEGPERRGLPRKIRGAPRTPEMEKKSVRGTVCFPAHARIYNNVFQRHLPSSSSRVRLRRSMACHA